MGLNGHDPDPGDWHPDDSVDTWPSLGQGWVSPTPGPALSPAGGPAGEGGDGPVVRLDTIPDTPPPAPRLGFIAPEPGSITLVSGDGGAGKGTFAAWLAGVATGQAGRVLVIDAEGHPREWRRRVDDLGGDPAKVLYWAHPGGELVLDDYAGVVDFVIVDSAAYFWLDTEKAADAPVRMQQQAKLAGVPMIVIAHKPKTSLSGGHAYGSVFWSNAARLHLELADSILTCRKVNDLLGMEKGMEWEVDMDKDMDGRIVTYAVTEREAVKPADKTEQVRNLLWIRPHTQAELVEETGYSLNAISRYLKAIGAVESEPVGEGRHRASTWTI